MRLILMMMFAWAAVAQANVPAPEPTCRADSQCIISTFDGCCGACCPQPRAWLRSELAREEERCTLIECTAPACTEACDATPSVAGLVAKCDSGVCVSQRTDPSFCSSDRDCVVASLGGCCGGCCPAPQGAVTRAELMQRQQRCGAVRCKSPDCREVACSQQVPEPIRPVCRRNRCVAEAEALAPECRADSDCVVTREPAADDPCRTAPCGCCNPRAVPRQLKRDETRPPDKRFGLIVGQTPACAPCATPSPTEAVCRSGRCITR